MARMNNFDGIHIYIRPLIFSPTFYKPLLWLVIIIKARPTDRIKLFKAENAIRLIEPMI